MRLAVLVLALLALPALSGCLAGDGTITAKEGLSAATKAAEAFGVGTPALINVASLEPFREYILQEEGDDIEVYLHLDDDPGDGKAPGWVYSFAAGDDHIMIGYASGLGVLFEAREGDAFVDHAPTPITDWQVDSDAAARALAEHEDWPETGPESTLFWDLIQGDECPLWVVGHVNASGLPFGGQHVAEVDGCTGDVLSVTFDEGGFACHGEYTWGTGTATPLFGAGQRDVTLEHTGTIHYVVNYGTGIGDAAYTLTGPNGIIDQGNSDVDQTLENMPPGTYTLTVEDALGVWQVYSELSAESCS